MSTHRKPHGEGDPEHVRVLVVTVSDTRTEADDESGRVVRDALEGAGHLVVGYRIVKDDPEAVARILDEDLPASGAEVAILDGGTGISPRDGTYEVVSARLDKRLDGFGELFRMLSFREVGPRAMLSRAVAGLSGAHVVFALPGSRAAVRLAMDELVLPVLPHLVGQMRHP